MILEGRTITAIVSDFDGTIIRPGMQEPPKQFFDVVEKLLQQNIQFIAASGRQYPNLRNMLEPLADRIGFIAENGALVVWKGQIVHKSTIPRCLAMELIEDMKAQPNSEILVSGEGTSYIVPNDPQYAYLMKHQVKNIVSILNDFGEIPEELLKVSIYYPNGILPEAEFAFHRKYDSRLLVVESGNGWLDFMNKESGKGQALKLLSQKMGFSIEQTAAFGDSENDISMLQAAGIGYAMSFARKSVQAASDVLCDSVEETLWTALHVLDR